MGRDEQTEAVGTMAQGNREGIGRKSGKHPLTVPRYGAETNPASEKVVQNHTHAKSR